MPGKAKEASTQQYLPIKEIRDGVVVMKDGSMRTVIMVSSINFALKNEDEKNAIISSYQSFLNSLNFPIQIMVRSRKLHLDKYLGDVNTALQKQTNELLKLQTTQYIEFINELLQYANIMEKRFFIVVPYYPSGVEKVGFVKKFLSSEPKEHSSFEMNKMELTDRTDRVISGLGSVGMRCVVLNTEDLIELYYTVYNPDTAGEEKLRDSGLLEAPVISGGGQKNAR